MTTIAMTKKQIACDLQMTHHSGYKFRGATKVHKITQPSLYPKPFYVGFCGSVTAGQEGISWLSDPTQKLPRSKGAEFVILTEDKKMFTANNVSNWIEITEPFYAVGSGAMYAIGAMSSGKSPEEAVKIAAKHDPYTGHGFKVFNVE